MIEMYNMMKASAIQTIATSITEGKIKTSTSLSTVTEINDVVTKLTIEHDRSNIGFNVTCSSKHEITGSFFFTYEDLSNERERLLNKPQKEFISKNIKGIALNKDGDWIGMVSPSFDDEINEWYDESNEDGTTFLLGSSIAIPACYNWKFSLEYID